MLLTSHTLAFAATSGHPRADQQSSLPGLSTDGRSFSQEGSKLSEASINHRGRAGRAHREPEIGHDLLMRYRETGDRDVFAALTKHYDRELRAFLTRFLGNAQDAEDVLQNTWMKVHLKMDRFDESHSFRPWLYTVANNSAIDFQRKSDRHKGASLSTVCLTGNYEFSGSTLASLLVASIDGPVECIEARELEDMVLTELNRLPDTLRITVELVYLQGMLYREAAENLGIPMGTVKSRLHQALVALNRAMMPHLEPNNRAA